MAGKTSSELVFHLFMIPVSFLDAATGGKLTIEHFNRKPGPGQDNPGQVLDFAEEVMNRFNAWWIEYQNEPVTPMLNTYYGEQPLHKVLERTCWHTLQHCRQLVLLLESDGINPVAQIQESLFAGLPLPTHVWDDEVKFGEQIQ